MPRKPIDMTRHPEYQRRQRERQAARQRQSEQDAEMGRQALKAFQEHRGKLIFDDREAIAKNLYWEVEDYYVTHPDEERYLLLKEAALTDENSTKVLSRLVLKPGESMSTKEGLYAASEKYRWLIQTLAQRCGESLDSLASRVLLGTTFYPRQPNSPSPDMNEAHLIMAALQKAVDRVDAEFHLFEQCLEVSRLRNAIESVYWKHLEETGEDIDLASWHSANPELIIPQPDWPMNWPDSGKRFATENGLWWPLEDGRLTDWNEQEEWLIVPDNTYWAITGNLTDPTSARVQSGPTFFYFPHIYLGPAINWRQGADPIAAQQYQEWLLEELMKSEEPQVYWEASKKCYELRQSEHSLPDGTTTIEYDSSDSMNEAALWLVIYPDPFMNKLVPMIYSLGEVPGAELTQLTASVISDFGIKSRWEYFGRDAPTLLNRLKDLTGYRDGNFKVYEAWRETAARFHWNPILRRHPEIIDEIRYRKHLEDWIGKDWGRTSEEREED